MSEEVVKTTPVKKPADRKPKADEPVKVKLRGQTFTVEREAMDDLELLDEISEMEAGNPALLPSVLNRLLGPEQKKMAYEAIRDEKTGRVSTSKGMSFLKDVFEALVPNS